MAGDGAGSIGQDGGEAVSMPSQPLVADCVDAAVQAMEAPRGHFVGDGAPSEAKACQLTD
jgi:hypothetical protein